MKKINSTSPSSSIRHRMESGRRIYYRYRTERWLSLALNKLLLSSLLLCTYCSISHKYRPGSNIKYGLATGATLCCYDYNIIFFCGCRLLCGNFIFQGRIVVKNIFIRILFLSEYFRGVSDRLTLWISRHWWFWSRDFLWPRKAKICEVKKYYIN